MNTPTKIFAFLAALLFAICADEALSKPQELSIDFNAPAQKALRLDQKRDIVIANNSTHAVRIWNENCSWGWYNVSLKLRCGKQTIELKRRPKPWRANVPSYLELKPGEKITRSINVSDDTWPKSEFEKFARSHSSVEASVSYMIEPDFESKKNEIWTGNCASEFHKIDVPRLPVPPM